MYVQPNSLAEELELKAGDRIIEINGFTDSILEIERACSGGHIEDNIIAIDRGIKVAAHNANQFACGIVSDNIVALAGSVNKDIIASTAGESIIANLAIDCIIATCANYDIWAIVAGDVERICATRAGVMTLESYET